MRESVDQKISMRESVDQKISMRKSGIRVPV
jgi:hypothetical protein